MLRQPALIVVGFTAACIAVGIIAVPAMAEGQARVVTPRLAPVEQIVTGQGGDATPDLGEALAAFGVDADSATNLVRTLARHPEALAGLAPLAGYVRERAMATAVDQTLLALRVAWLSRSEAMWAEQAAEAQVFGFREDDLRRIAEGPDAGWGAWDTTVLQAADELYRDSFVSDATWSKLAQLYNARQIVDVIFTVAEHTMLGMIANSLGVQPDQRFADRRPTDIPRQTDPPRATPVRLQTARIDPVPLGEQTDDERELLDPGGTGQPVINLFATLVRFPALYRARGAQSAYIRTRSTLSGRVREMLILRIGWLCGAEYEWAQHAPIGRQEGLTDDEIRDVAIGPDASAWSELDAALLRAADELHRDDTVSDSTWATLAESYSDQELIDVVVTVAGYRLVSMVLNSLGVQPESGTERFPDLPR